MYASPSSERQQSSGWKPPAVPSNGYDDYSTPIEDRASSNLLAASQSHDLVGRHLLVETALLDSQRFEVLQIEEVDALKKEHARLTSRIEGTQRKLALENKVRDAAQSLQRLYSVKAKDRPSTPQSPKKTRSSLLGSRQRSSSSISGGGDTLSQAEEELSSSAKKVEELNLALSELDGRRQYVERRLLRHTAAVLQVAHQESEQDKVRNVQVGIERSNGYQNLALQTNGHHARDLSQESASVYSPDEFDGIRDILVGKPVDQIHKVKGRFSQGQTKAIQEQHEQQMASVQSRLEQLNDQLRSVIAQASHSRGKSVELEPEPLHTEDAEDAAGRLDRQLDVLQRRIRTVEDEQRMSQQHQNNLQDDARHNQHAVEGQLEGLNNQLHNILLLSSQAHSVPSLDEPPQMTGHGYEGQMRYLEESLLTVEQLLQQSSSDLHSAIDSQTAAARELEDVRTKAASHVEKSSQYETVLLGLWEILQSDGGSQHSQTDREVDDAEAPMTPLRESFSLQAFSNRVQHLFDRATSAKEQQDILRRQIQQQRELNNTSAAEKDRQLTDLQGTHDALRNEHETLRDEHGAAQQKLEVVLARHAEVETELGESKAEMLNIMNEVEQLKRGVAIKQQEHARGAEDVANLSKHIEESGARERQLLAELDSHKSQNDDLQQQIEDLEAQISELTDDARIFSVESQAKQDEAERKHAELTESLATASNAKEAAERLHANVSNDMTNMEQEVIRLTTELTLAKAELDGAYGSRAERAKEVAANPEIQAQLASIEALNQRNDMMSHELRGLQEERDAVVAEREGIKTQHADLAGRYDSVLQELSQLRSQSSTTSQSSQRQDMLERELAEMTNEYQDLTRESIELEKERGQLEDLIDGLRDRCEVLEAQLSDEKVRWLGIKSPTGGPDTNGKEMTSTMVLRNEFKKMMRETRAEGVKLLRVSTLDHYTLQTMLTPIPRPSKKSAASLKPSSEAYAKPMDRSRTGQVLLRCLHDI